MAKSMRSKHKKKMRSLRRQKFKPLYDKKLKALAEVSLALEEEALKNTDTPMKEQDSEAITNEGAMNKNTTNTMEIDTETDKTGNPDKKRINKLMKAKVPRHLLSQRKKRKLVQKEKEKKMGKNKKKGLKW